MCEISSLNPFVAPEEAVCNTFPPVLSLSGWLSFTVGNVGARFWKSGPLVELYTYITLLDSLPTCSSFSKPGAYITHNPASPVMALIDITWSISTDDHWFKNVSFTNLGHMGDSPVSPTQQWWITFISLEELRSEKLKSQRFPLRSWLRPKTKRGREYGGHKQDCKWRYVSVMFTAPSWPRWSLNAAMHQFKDTMCLWLWIIHCERFQWNYSTEEIVPMKTNIISGLSGIIHWMLLSNVDIVFWLNRPFKNKTFLLFFLFFFTKNNLRMNRGVFTISQRLHSDKSISYYTIYPLTFTSILKTFTN